MIELSTDAKPHKAECVCERGHVTHQVVDLYVSDTRPFWRKLLPRDGFCWCGRLAFVSGQDDVFEVRNVKAAA